MPSRGTCMEQETIIGDHPVRWALHYASKAVFVPRTKWLPHVNDLPSEIRSGGSGQHPEHLCTPGRSGALYRPEASERRDGTTSTSRYLLTVGRERSSFVSIAFS